MEEEIKEIKLDTPPASQISSSSTFLGKIRAKLSSVKLSRGVIVVLAVFVALLLTLGVPLTKTYLDGRVAYQQAFLIKDALKQSDLDKAETAIKATRQQATKVKNDVIWLSWASYIPFLGGYFSDLIHFSQASIYALDAVQTSIEAARPYADILGLKGKGSFTGGTTEDRIATLVQTLDKISPQIDTIAGKLTLVRQEIDQVNPERYFETIASRQVKSRIVAVKEFVDLADQLLTEARPMVKQLPDLLGVNGEKKYLVIFQNDKELRPTGGFITAYAIFRVEKGRIHLNSSDDIYKLDDTISSHVTPPDPISKYLNVYGWRIRDSNFSPDFPSSMQVFSDLYGKSSAKEKIDGIIAMDTHVLLKMMDVLGSISIYGTNFTTQKTPACDCPMVIYELEKYADEPKNYERGSRKDIIGVLLSSMMQKTLSSGRNIYGPLFQAALDEAKQKHMLFYLYNPDAQKGIQALGFGGAIKTFDGDYLHINDANLAGAKSNLYIVESVKQDVNVIDGGANITLTLDYRYPHEADNCSLERKIGLCLAGIYRDYLRVYLPKRAEVGEVLGFENKSKTFEDLNHTVVDGFFTVVPQGLAKIQIKYQVPGDFRKRGEYKSLIQKQPGTDGNHYVVTVNGKKQEFNLTEDKELTIRL